MTHELELLTTAEMAECDRFTIAGGIPGIELMENAGYGVAELAQEAGEGAIHVLCGPGNNGGDGFVAARLLKEWGRDVRVFLFGDLKGLKGDAAAAAAKWDGPVGAVSPLAVKGADIVVDAMFGAGLARPLDGVAAETVDAINASDAWIIAVDVPSGLDGTTGQAQGPAVRADETITFFRPKVGHMLYPGRGLCGDLTVIDIDIPESVLDKILPKTFVNDPEHWLAAMPWPEEDAHKYARGHALVVTGDELHTGASRLAARAALRIGAGLVTLAGTRDALRIHAGQVTDIMLAEAGDAGGLNEVLKDERKNALLIGPAAGVGMKTKAMTLSMLETRRPAVLDADVFTSFKNAPGALLNALHGACVLTPHEGEFARIFPGLLEKGEGRLAAARAAAAQSKAIILLKGPDTIIAAPDGRAVINANAPPTLATAGSGDVLAGLITGLLAQGVEPFVAAAMAAWIHGEAANVFGAGLVAGDLPDLVPDVLAELSNWDEFSPLSP